MCDRFFNALMFGVLKANPQYNHSLKQLKSTGDNVKKEWIYLLNMENRVYDKRLSKKLIKSIY